MKDQERRTKKVYQYQFGKSSADMALPQGMIEFHKKNFSKYFEMSPEEFRGKSVLETGAGPGKHAAVLHILGSHVTAVDLLDVNVEAILRLKAHHNFINMSALCVDLMDPLPKDWAKFDLLSAHNWLQHAENPGVVLRNLVNKLKIGGRFYLSVYQSDTFRFFIDQIARNILRWSDRDVILKLIPFHFPTGFLRYENPDCIAFENILDDFFVPYMWTFRYESLTRFLKELGCTPVIPLRGRKQLYKIDDEPLKIGFVKTLDNDYGKNDLEYQIDQFDLSHIKNVTDRKMIETSVKLARQAITAMQSTGEEEGYIRSAFTLALYELRAISSLDFDVVSRHRILQDFLRGFITGDVSSVRAWESSQQYYTQR